MLRKTFNNLTCPYNSCDFNCCKNDCFQMKTVCLLMSAQSMNLGIPFDCLRYVNVSILIKFSLLTSVFILIIIVPQTLPYSFSKESSIII